MAYRVSVWPAERETMCRGGSWSVTALPTLSVTSTGKAPASGAVTGAVAAQSKVNDAAGGDASVLAEGVRAVEEPPPAHATAAASSAARAVTSMQDLISVTSRNWPGRHPGGRNEITPARLGRGLASPLQPMPFREGW